MATRMSYRHGRMDGPVVLVHLVVWLFTWLVWKPVVWAVSKALLIARRDMS